MSRKEQLEQMLESQPEDLFLRYAVAMEYLKEDADQGMNRLKQIIETNPEYDAAYFQLAQKQNEIGDVDDAKATLEQGISAAQQSGNDHAAGEMREYLEML